MKSSYFCFYVKAVTKVYTHLKVFKIQDNEIVVLGVFKVQNGACTSFPSEVKMWLIHNKHVESFGEPSFYNCNSDEVSIKEL